MPSPFGAFGLQDRPLRCGGASGTATGQILQGERCFRVASQFDGGLLESVSCSSSGGLQCRERNPREHGRGLLLLPPLARIRGFKFRPHHEFVERNGQGGHLSSFSSPVMALGGGGRDLGDEAGKSDTGDMQARWNLGTSPSTSSSSSSSSDVDASWEQISMVFRICYSVAMYGGLAFAGHVICSFTGVDLWGGFELSPEVITTGFGYAVPPMITLLFILEDEIVKSWGPARAIRDVEDEELLNFFSGMTPWQFPFVVASGAIAEELFFRVAIQGGLTHALLMCDKGVTDSTVGLAALTGVIPLFVPFSQFFATALTAALTSFMYYVMTSPKDPKYVVAPITPGRNNRGDIRERVSAWYERRQQKKIYSPLMEGLLAMYLGFEWMYTGNILAPIITHTVYSLVIVGNGLRRIDDNREKLRQRVSRISGERLARIENRLES